ncbi:MULTISPECIES: efflux RND transporter periplasmic adaptor subunit [unclassified Nitrobacter]|uniref:efflux RND transporter periplasmic adaptor subunit n=1 Tax=unclassified Nitrobacter TaxID=2620411 RepID=UPI00092C5A0F|nr:MULTISPECIES: efflux RND transporter periplasmic adaptor subunit [unclassified Nitrobacter]MBN9147963.1 efflux RND transporter periplasmic adaptor subunit [Nitrobacter sp.]MBN9489875.1 efflux RND transporter periplasmic adaptor subunit [Alphaproteobacteria bacterium]OJV01452.1 MAG: efflux transporter periplasmic adaptor subunit [Nitrobacter sp. 62-23]
MLRLASFWRTRAVPRAVIGLLTVPIMIAAAVIVLRVDRGSAARSSALDSEIKSADGKLRLTASQWSAVTVQPIEQQAFRSEFRTEGKVAIDQNLSTRIFAPYAGRVTKLTVAPGDEVQKGQLLFVIAAADSVDAQKDFVVALASRNKAVSQVNLAQIVERRMSNLAKDKAASQREWQEAQANLTAAENDSRSAEIALQAARNRLRLVGKTDAEIETFEKTGALTPDAPVYAPLAGTVLQRKIGPGQYVSAGAGDSDPVFLIGDTSKVWIAAYVRETDVAKVRIGERLTFKVLTEPDRVFETRIDYVAPGIDPDSRRLLVRASVDNADGLLKPEMFASVTIVTSDGKPTPAVPLDAVIYEGNNARVWVVGDDHSVELRQIKLGQSSERMIQVLDGLHAGEKIVTRGSLFIDRMTTAKQT